MQIIDVYTTNGLTNANNIKNAFNNHVTGYFSSVEVDTETSDTWIYVKFYLQGSDNPVMSLAISKNYSAYGSDFHKILIGGNTYNCSSGYSDGFRFSQIAITDNAIAIRQNVTSDTNYSNWFLICKNTNGDLMVLTSGSSNVSMLSRNDTGQHEYAIYNLNDGSRWSFYHYKQRNTSGIITGIPAVHPSAGETKNVWLSVNACYDGIGEPFTYTINGESYVGIGFNHFIIKST